MFLLKKAGIKVVKAGIGNINKTDVISAIANLKSHALNAIVLGFNVSLEEDVRNEERIKILAHDVIYKLIEDFEKWRIDKKKEIEREKLAGLT